MTDRFLGLDATRASIAAKSCVAIIVGYALSLYFDWKASSVATTIVILQTSALGSTLHKATLRITGTLVGAVVGLILVGTLAHDRDLFFLAMALMTGACVWGMQGSSYQYAWLLTLLTTAIVGWPASSDALNSFPTAVERVTVVVVGIVLSTLAHAVFWPITAADQFESAAASLLSKTRDMLQRSQRAMSQSTADLQQHRKTSDQMLVQGSRLGPILQTARSDSKRIHRYFRGYRQLCDEILELALAAITVQDVIAASDPGDLRGSSDSPVLHQAFERADNALEATLKQQSLSRDGSVEVSGVEQVDLDTTASSPHCALLLHRIRKVEAAASRVQSTFANVENASTMPPSVRSESRPKPAVGTRLGKSLLATCQVLLALWLIVLLDWPAGFQAGMLLVMIVAFQNALLPVALPIHTMAKSVLTALPVAAVFYFVIMPRTDGFSDLAPWMAILFFPFLYGVSSPHPLTSMSSMLVILLANSLVFISDTPPSYNFAAFMTTYLGMSGGFGVGLLLAYVFERRNPRRGVHRLVSSLLKKSGDHLARIETSSARESVAADRKQMLATLQKLQKLSMVANDGGDWKISPAQIRVALVSVEALVVRLLWADSADVQSAAVGAKQCSNAWCVTSLRQLGDQLSCFQGLSTEPLPTEPSKTRGDEDENVNYYRFLGEAILDCQDKLSSVDWRRWCGNRF